MTNPLDAELVLAIAQGSRDSLAALYDRYASLSMGVAFRILNSKQEAEDVVQDAFLEIWRRAGTYDPTRGTVRTWLLLLVRSRALDRRRSIVMKASAALELADDAQVVQPDTLDHARVGSLMHALPESQRAVLELGYYGGLSSTEIAVKLGIPVGTVKSRVAAALASLRSAVGADVEGAT
jgi:RNA polymerase sigma-70 factor, ECF subfamily